MKTHYSRLSDDISNKRLIITGAGSGIGLALVKLALDDDAQIVALSFQDEDREILSALLPSRQIIHADLSRPIAVEQAMHEAVACLGGVDLFAGIAGQFTHEAGLDTSLDQWDKTIALNLTANFISAKIIGHHLVQQQKGAMCFASSQIGIVGHPRAAAYASSKAGLNGLVKALAIELAPHQIRINAVAPGPIATPMTEKARSDNQRKAGLLAQIPLGRFGEANEVAMVIRFLLSDAANFITGQVLPVDGGVTAV